jgi:hypothetical protein
MQTTVQTTSIQQENKGNLFDYNKYNNNINSTTKKSSNEILLESRQLAAQTEEIGRKTIEELQAQNEILEASEDTLEETEYYVQKSMKVLR